MRLSEMFPQIWCSALVVLMVSAVPTGGFAQNSIGRISVNVVGETEAVPDQLEMIATFSVKEKTFAEASEAFEKKRQQIVNALNPMDFPNLEIKSEGKQISDTQNENAMGVMIMEGGALPAKPVVNYTAKETLRIVVKQNEITFADSIELLTKVETEVTNFGGKIGGPQVAYMPISRSLIYASLSDQADAEELAFADGIAKARKKAARLAKVSGLELGKIVSVKESTPDETQPTEIYAAMMGEVSKQTANVGKIKVKATLTVEFTAE